MAPFGQLNRPIAGGRVEKNNALRMSAANSTKVAKDRAFATFTESFNIVNEKGMELQDLVKEIEKLAAQNEKLVKEKQLLLAEKNELEMARDIKMLAHTSEVNIYKTLYNQEKGKTKELATKVDRLMKVVTRFPRVKAEDVEEN